jgi:tetratricopeptide (TPR) repeat protein
VWAETGLFTLLFFAAFWVLVFAGPRGTGGSARPPSRGIVTAAIVAAAALYLAMQPPGAFAGAFPSAAAYAAGALAAAAATAVLWPAISGADVGLVRAGLAGGLVGFLVSSAVDVTFSDAPAAAAAVFAAAAYAPRGKTAALASGGFNARIAAGAALVALMAFVGAGFLPLGQAHSAMEDARHYALRGDLARAAERARFAMTLDPTNVRPVYQLAYVYEQAARGPERQRSFDLAERLYKQALALDECFLPAHEGLARLYVSAGPRYCSKALDRYATLLKCYPTSAQYHIGAAEALDRMGGADADAAALHHYLTALEIDRHVEEHGAQLSAEEKAKVSERIRAIESRYPPEVIGNMRKATGDVTK